MLAVGRSVVTLQTSVVLTPDPTPHNGRAGLPLQAVSNAASGGSVPTSRDARQRITSLAQALLGAQGAMPELDRAPAHAAAPAALNDDVAERGQGLNGAGAAGHSRGKRASKGSKGSSATGPARPANPPPKAGRRGPANKGKDSRDGPGRRLSLHRPSIDPTSDRRPLEHGNPKSRNPVAMLGHADGAAASAGHSGPGKSAAGEAGQATGARDSLLASPLKHAVPQDPVNPQPGPDKPAPPPLRLPGGLQNITEAASPSPRSSGRGSSIAPSPLAAVIEAEHVDCQRVDDAQIAFALVRRQRYQPGLVHFCIPAAQAPWLKSLFNTPADSERGMGRWMASRLLGEPVAQTVPLLQVRHYHSVDDIDNAPPSQGHRRHGQRRFALLTLSLLDAPLRHEANGRPLTVMAANTFRLLQQADPGHDQSIHLAYFLRQTSGVCQGVKGGFLKVGVTDQGHYRVHDARHATTIAAPTLALLVASLEKLTGLRHETAAADASGTFVDPASNLFVDETSVLTSDGSGAHLPYNAALDPFTPVMIVVPGYAAPFGLYRGSFQWMADGERLIYADEQGRDGTLRFGRAVVGRGERQLVCTTQGDRQFVARFGLRSGGFYSPDRVMEQLTDEGLVSVLGPPPEWGTRSPEAALRCPAPAPAPLAMGHATGLVLPASQFQFDEGVLHYTDHDGTAGLLHFDTVATGSSPRYWLVDRPGSPGALFAARHGLQSGKGYTDVEIRWALVGEGFDESAPAGAA